MVKGQCPLCGEKAVIGPWPEEVEDGGMRFAVIADKDVNCKSCGQYTLGETVGALKADYRGRLHLISGLTKTHWVSTGKPLRLTRECLDELLASTRVPKTPAQCVDRAVAILADKSEYYGADVQLVVDTDYPFAFARHAGEFVQFLKAAREEGWTSADPLLAGTSNIHLRMKGWRHVEELRKTSAMSDQAFVATWFDNEMDLVYHDGIHPALNDTGWEPLWLKLTKDCGKIDDQITAGIVQSGLVVADFTGHRPSVYFEAGLAKGLGIPVILTCHKDHKDCEDAGFDTEHYRHIFWKEPTDLRSKLVDFIGAMGLDRKKALPPGMREEQ